MAWGITVPLEGIPLAEHPKLYRELADLGVGEISTATTASITPIESDATTAPARLPSPPSTTIESSREMRS